MCSTSPTSLLSQPSMWPSIGSGTTTTNRSKVSGETAFLAGNQLYEPQTHGMLVSKKTIAIFSYKQRLMSIDMKIKIVQHVKRE